MLSILFLDSNTRQVKLNDSSVNGTIEGGYIDIYVYSIFNNSGSRMPWFDLPCLMLKNRGTK